MGQLEKNIEGWMKREIEGLGGLFLKFVSPGNDGVPDRIALLPSGRIVFVELKTHEGRLSLIQGYQIDRIRTMGQEVCIVYGYEGARDLLYDLESENTLARVYGRS